MPAPVTTDSVWKEIDRQTFGVLGFVTPRGEARSAGIIYVTEERELYIGTRRTSWKARHVSSNPHVSMTVTIARRVPFMPWIRIPPATITFRGQGSVHSVDGMPAGILHALLRGVETDTERAAGISIIRIRPKGDFVTYGVGVSLLTMRKQEQARGRAPVS